MGVSLYREIIQDLSDAHAATEVIKDVGHRDSNAGFAAANSWINADEWQKMVHSQSV